MTLIENNIHNDDNNDNNANNFSNCFYVFFMNRRDDQLIFVFQKFFSFLLRLLLLLLNEFHWRETTF